MPKWWEDVSMNTSGTDNPFSYKGNSNSITISIEFCNCKKPEVQWRESKGLWPTLLRHHDLNRGRRAKYHIIPYCVKCGLRISYECLEDAI